MPFKIDRNPIIGNAPLTSKSDNALQSDLERLSSGKRLNSAKDDAARRDIAMRFLNQISGSQQAHLIVNDGNSMAQSGEGAVQEISGSGGIT